MIKKQSVNADIRQWSMEGAHEPVKSQNVPVSDSKSRKTKLPTLNIYSVLIECPGNTCDFITSVYGQGDLDMWHDYKTGFPSCPKCGNILRKARRQYRILE